jgi:hypothetical protein
LQYEGLFDIAGNCGSEWRTSIDDSGLVSSGVSACVSEGVASESSENAPGDPVDLRAHKVCVNDGLTYNDDKGKASLSCNDCDDWKGDFCCRKDEI